jgi:chromate transporter
MNVFLVYFILLKATLTSFSGLAGLPIVRQDFILERHAITDAQLNAAVAVGRTIPGPNGLYVVCVGYYAAGIPGAIAGTLALITPAFLIIFLLLWVGRHAGHPIVKSIISAVLLAGAALLVVTTLQLARSAVTDGFSMSLAAASFALMVFTPIDTVWVMLAAAAIGLARLFLR